MYYLFASIWLAAAGSGVALPVAEQAANAQSPDAGSQTVSGSLKAGFGIAAAPAPVTSVTRLHRLADGALVQQCDIVSAEAVRALERGPRGEWIEVPAAEGER